MITKKEFMKDYRQMSSEEKRDYIHRVDKWSDETFPRLLAEVNSWLNVPVKEFKEGQLLCSAILRARPFLLASRNYKDVQVVLNKMNTVLKEVREKSGLAQYSTMPAGDKRRWFAATEVKSAPDEDGVVTVKKYEEPEVGGMRPQHVSEYIHLLPKDLQEEAKNLKQMHMELAMYRCEAEELSRQPGATKEQVAEKACKAVSMEQRIRTLYATIDAAYKQAKGQKLDSDEEALLAPAEEPVVMKRPGEYSKEEIDAMPEGRVKDECLAARQEADKKYLRRGSKNITEEYKQQLLLRAKELLDWGLELSEKALLNLNEAGVIIEGVNDVVEPTPIITVSEADEKVADVKKQAEDLFGNMFANDGDSVEKVK